MVALSGLLAFLTALAVLKICKPVDQIVPCMLFVMTMTAVGVFLPDLLMNQVHRQALVRSVSHPSWARVGTKLLGLYGVIGLIAMAYALFPEYHGDFYKPFWALLLCLGLPWLLLSVPYVYWLDSRMENPKDGLWHLGRLMLGKRKEIDHRLAATVVMGWLVKGFFLPLMFVYACNDLQHFLSTDLADITSFRQFYDFMFFFMFFIDVGMVSMGYLCTFRLLDTHIRSVEPTLLGWCAALVCYEPFWSLVGRQYLSYDSGYPWGAWLQDMPALYAIWGSAILVLTAIYVWATVSFGARFSNLTHRGIITNGPYRWSKHPAYISKNLSWWLIAVPFLPQGGIWHAISCCMLLLLVNGIYWLRARTEEAHLLRDPVYQAYAAWIAEHGLLACLSNRWRVALKR